MSRREALSNWLSDTADQYIQQEVAHSAYQVIKDLDYLVIFYCSVKGIEKFNNPSTSFHSHLFHRCLGTCSVC